MKLDDARKILTELNRTWVQVDALANTFSKLEHSLTKEKMLPHINEAVALYLDIVGPLLAEHPSLETDAMIEQ